MTKTGETIVLLGKRRNLYYCDDRINDSTSPPLLQVRIVISHHPQTGQPIQKTYKGYTADEIRAKVEKDYEDGIIILADCRLGFNITVGELVDRYMSECTADLRESTLHNYHRHACTIKKHLGSIPVILLTASQVYSFLLKVKTDSSAGKSPDGVCAANDCLFFLRWVMSYGVKNGIVRVNPCCYVSKLRKVREERLLANPESIAAYLQALEEDEVYGDLLAVIALTGIRIGEGIGMQIDAVDREKMKLQIKSHMLYTVVDGKHQNVFYLGRKSGDIYTINLNTLVLPHLDRALEKQRTRATEYPEKYYNPNNLLFTKKFGEGFIEDTVRRHHRAAAKKAGIADLKPHDFRRLVATYIYEITGSVSMIQDALGQKDPRVAQMYIHRTSTMDAKIRQCQNDLIDRIINS